MYVYIIIHRVVKQWCQCRVLSEYFGRYR